MLRRVAFLTANAVTLLALSGCALNFLSFERRAAWRGQAEAACMSSRPFMAGDLLERLRGINGRGTCGVDSPLKVMALAGGQVTIGPSATLGCPVTAAIESWLAAAVQPSAMARFGSPVVEIRQASNYACRTANNVRGASLSEHAFGNALDISAFRLADGREVTVRNDWRNGEQMEKDFLREVFLAACAQFGTVLGPGYPNHDDHFHLDLARHGANGTTRYCRPQNVTPPAPAFRDPFAGFGIAGAPPVALPGAAVPGLAGYAAETPATGPAATTLDLWDELPPGVLDE